jgi:peroxiredoxin
MSKIKVGMTLPDFELSDENGVTHTLSELQGDQVMVLSLGRGEHCPRERQHQRELLKFYDWCSVAFTQLVSVLPNELYDVSKLKISTGASWTYLADTDLELQAALDIREYTDPIHAATVPHVLILSPGLKVERVYVGYWFWGRPSAYRLWDDLEDVFRTLKADWDPTSAAAKAAWKRATANGAVPAHH